MLHCSVKYSMLSMERNQSLVIVSFKVVPEGCCRNFVGVKVKTVKLIGGRGFLAARTGLNVRTYIWHYGCYICLRNLYKWWHFSRLLDYCFGYLKEKHCAKNETLAIFSRSNHERLGLNRIGSILKLSQHFCTIKYYSRWMNQIYVMIYDHAKFECGKWQATFTATTYVEAVPVSMLKAIPAGTWKCVGSQLYVNGDTESE